MATQCSARSPVSSPRSMAASAARYWARQGLGVLRCAACRVLHQRGADAQVQHLALQQADRGVDHIARHAVLEAQRADLLAGEQEVVVGQRAQLRAVRRATGDARQQPGRHHVADHGRRAHDLHQRRAEPLHARFDELVQPARRAGRRAEPPAVAACGRVAELVDEQRVAARARADLRHHEGVGARQLGRDGLRRGALLQRPQQHLGKARGRLARRGVGAARHDQQQPRVGQPLGLAQHLLRGPVGPLPVVDEHHQRLRSGQFGEGLDEGARACRQRGHVQRLQHLAKRQQRRAAQATFATAAQHPAFTLVRVVQEFLDQPGLADAGRPHHFQGRGLAGAGAIEHLHQPLEFVLAAEQARTRPAALWCVDAAFEPRLDAVHEEGRLAALHAQHAGRAGTEEAARRPQRLVADHDLVRPCGVGQARGDVGHRAHQFEAAALDVAGADQHQAGVDAGVQVEFEAGRQGRCQPPHGLVQAQRGLDGAAAGVLLRHGVAEHGQQPIALHAHDGAAPARHGLLVGDAQRGQQRRVLLRLHRAGQFGRAREIGKQQRDVVAVRRRPRSRCRSGGRGLILRDHRRASHRSRASDIWRIPW
jgi:hypothetical protein